MSDSSTHHRTDALAQRTVFSLLSNDARRRAVAYLAKRDAPVTLNDLADVVASPDETERDSEPAAARERVAVALHHVHLPKLDAADVVDYDVDANAVTPAAVDELTPFLDGDAA